MFIRDLDANPTVQSSLVFGIATDPDLVRLLAVPVFAWAAYRDVRTRRVPNRTWLPLVAVGVLALAWDLLALTALGTGRQLFLIQSAISLGFVAPLGYVFWRIGGFGGADAKAIITLAVVFPVYPAYDVFGATYPIHDAPLGVLSFTILSNAVLIGLLYPLALAVRNLPRGELTPAMLIGRPVPIEEIPTEYGRLLETPGGFTRRGLDIDAFRMYLRWRGITFSDLRNDPDRFRNSVPTDPNEPGDGAIEGAESGEAGGDPGALEAAEDDPWGADAFLTEYAAYGTTPAGLRAGLRVLSEPDRTSVWISPGIPFIVPILVGLLVSLTAGDVLFWLLSAVGL